MLRLRFCYVSKAPILTVPVRHVPVEKSKSRLNSKGLMAPHRGDAFSLANLIAKRARLWLQKIRLSREYPAVMQRLCLNWRGMRNPSMR
jgi:hypothetical protein